MTSPELLLALISTKSPLPSSAPTIDRFNTSQPKPKDIESLQKKDKSKVRTISCPIERPGQKPTFDNRCTLTLSGETPVITITPVSLDRRNNRPNELSVFTIADSNTIGIYYSGPAEARAEFMCYLNDAITTAWAYPDSYSKDQSLIINKFPDADQQILVSNACLNSFNTRTVHNIDNRRVTIEPDNRGFLGIFDTEPNPADPNNPFVLIKQTLKLVDGTTRVDTLAKIPLKEIISNLQNQEEVAGVGKSNINPILGNLKIPEKFLNKFPIDLTESDTGLLDGSTKQLIVAPTPTPTTIVDGKFIIPNQEIINPDKEPLRVVDISDPEGTKHEIWLTLQSPQGKNIQVITSDDPNNPLVLGLTHRLTNGANYSNGVIFKMTDIIRQQAEQYNSKLPSWLKNFFRLFNHNYNVDTPYTIEDSRVSSISRNFKLVAMIEDQDNNVLIVGQDPITNKTSIFSLKAKDLPDFINYNVEVAGYPDQAIANELYRISRIFSKNPKGNNPLGSVMIPVNSVIDLPRDTTMSNLQTYAQKNHPEDITVSMINQFNYLANLNIPSGAVIRPLAIQQDDGVYYMIGQINLNDYGDYFRNPDKPGYRQLLDQYGDIDHFPEYLKVKIPLIDTYSPFVGSKKEKLIPTPTPTSPQSSLNQFNENPIPNIAYSNNRLARIAAKKHRS